ncbi:MAG: PAS domain S-box protein [Betaproteobacteria bacterium]|nr:PAS domain S-box protein [Betaproteobacteria bacterium]
MADRPSLLRRWAAVARPRTRVVALIVVSAIIYVGIVAAVFVLALQNERSSARAALEAEASEVAQTLRNRISTDQGELELLLAQAATNTPPERLMTAVAPRYLAMHPEALRLERRDAQLQLLEARNRNSRDIGALSDRDQLESITAVACESALRQHQAQFSQSFYVPKSDGLGFENIDLCMPVGAPEVREMWVLSLSLTDFLRSMDQAPVLRHGEVHLSDVEGARLVTLSRGPRGKTEAAATALIALPGTTLQFGVTSRLAPLLPFPSSFAMIAAVFSLLLFVSVVFLARDVLRRQRAEAALSATLALRRAMEDSLVTGLRARDLEGRITYVNPAFCEIVGLSAERLIGSAPPQPYWPSESHSEYEQRLARRKTGVLAREVFETEFVRPDGQRVPVLVYEAPLVDSKGRHAGWMASVLDITEQRRVEAVARAQQDKLAEASRLTTVGELASTLSHELNQPLAAIASFAAAGQNLLRSGVPPHDIGALMDDIAAQAERAGRVVKSVRSFVKRGQRRVEPIRMDDMLRDVLPLIGLQARASQATLSSSTAPQLPLPLADKTLIEQVLLNLARNGFEAMADTPRDERALHIDIGLTSTEDGRHVVQVRVIDRGHGMPAQIEAAMAAPFHSTKPEGMGLGLSICRSVVEHYGGRLWFERNSPRGTIATFTLPVPGTV